MTGRKIAHYEILEEIGSGGMAVVYKAQDLRLGRVVALKVLNERFRRDLPSLRRFRREAQLTSTLSHPGICTIFDIEHSDENTFLVMEYLNGATLRQRLHSGPVSSDEALSILDQVLDALSEAHEHGVVHRDIKPENVFLLPDGRVKVLDFGLAKPTVEGGANADQTYLTTPGTVAGTIAYMSPEQVRGDPIEAASDIYSVGLVAYEMMTGVLPTRRRTTALTFSAILAEAPPPPSAVNHKSPAAFDRIILKTLRKNPLLRYRSASEMLVELRESVNRSSPLMPSRSIPSIESSSSDVAAVSKTGIQEPDRLRNSAPGLPVRPIGREPECLQIQSLMEKARAGTGNVLLIDGEPGIGKSHLLDFALAEAETRGCAVLSGRCSELQAAPPFFPFVEMIENVARAADPDTLPQLLGEGAPELAKLTPRLRQLIPGIPPPMDLPPGQDRYLIFSSLLDFLARAAGDRTLVVGIEDLHWADEATTNFLQFLSRHLRGRPVLLVGTLRQQGFDPSAPLAEAYRVLVRDRLVTRMSLRPLSRDSVGTMLARLSCVPPPPRVIDSVFEVTEGTPLYVEELYYDLLADHRALDEDGNWKHSLEIGEFRVPEGIRVILNRRQTRLSDPALKILQLGAVMGRRFSLGAIAACTEFPRAKVLEAMEEGERLQQIRSSSDSGDLQFAFWHELIRRTLLESVSHTRRLQLHLKLADYLQSNPQAEGDGCAQIAHHLVGAGALADPDRTRQVLVEAADAALRKTAFEDAIRFCGQALKCGKPTAGQQGEILYRKGLAQTGLNDWRAARESWLLALDLLSDQGSKETAGRICATLASQAIWTGRLDECYSISSRGLAIVEEEPSPIRSRLLAWAGHALSQGGNLQQGSALTDQAVAMARSVDDIRTFGHVMTHRSCEYFYSMRGREEVETGFEAIERLADVPWDRAEALAIVQIGLLGCGRLDDCRRIGQEAIRLATRIGHLGGLWMTQRMQGLCDLLETGDLEKFKAFANQDRVACEQAGLRWISESFTWLGLQRFWLGDWEGAGDLFREAVDREPEDFSGGFDSAHMLTWLAYTRSESGLEQHMDSARAVLDEGKPATVGHWSLLLALVEAAALQGQFEVAADCYSMVCQLLETGTLVRFNGSGLVETVAGVASTCAGDWDQSERHFKRAIEQADTLPHRIEQVEARRWNAWAWGIRSSPDSAARTSALVKQAMERAQPLGLQRHLSRVLEQIAVH